jgi:peroxiredoxin
VLAISIDSPEQAVRLVKNLAPPFAILSDPRMDVIRAYGMKGDGMDMADMGYVVIDKQGRIRTRRIDRRFGENVGAIARAVREAKILTLSGMARPAPRGTP